MTLPIDLHFKGLGRFHVRSGTTKRAVRKAMRDMFRTLYQMGRADILRDVMAKRVRPLEVYERYRLGKIEQMPTGALMRPVAAAWSEWLEGKELRRATRTDYAKAGDRLRACGGTGALLTELPAMLTAHRKASRGVHPRTFNKDRSAALSLVSSLLGERHWFYGECARVAPLKITGDRRMPYNPQTVAEAHALSAKLKPHHATTLWAYCLTGMRPEEMFEEEGNRWMLEQDRVRIRGTKTPASDRMVPRVGLLVKPSTKRRTFAKALAIASGGTVTPYDLRRSYAQWLDLAKVPQFRQDYYMAHGPRNLNELYKRAKDCAPALAEDGAALEDLVSAPVALRVVR